MIKVTHNKKCKDDTSQIYYELDYFKTMESKLNGEHKKYYRLYLDKELSREQAQSYLETCLDETIHFDSPEILAYLMTNKLSAKIILAPFKWQELNNFEARVLFNYVDKYVDEKSVNKKHKHIKKDILDLDVDELPVKIMKRISIYDFEVNKNIVKVIFGINKNYNPRYIRILNEHNKRQKITYHQNANDTIKDENLKFYSFEINTNETTQIIAKYMNCKLSLRTAKLLKLNEKDLYSLKKKINIKVADDKIINLGELSLKEKLILEYEYQKTLSSKDRRDRISIILSKKLLKSDKILVSDRGKYARDNGEEFYRYMMQQNVKNLYYILEESSTDYERLKNEGFKILKKGSFKHMIYLYNYKLLCTSNMSLSRYHCFKHSQYRKFSDLNDGKVVFLQHGIAYNDISKVYNKYVIDIDEFVCGAKAEYEFQTGLNYRDNFFFSGLPRYDKLMNKTSVPSENFALIFFTWRLNMTNNEPTYLFDFTQTEYFKQLERLTNDKDIISKLAAKDIKLKLFLHPNMEQYKEYFESNLNIDVCYGENADIAKLLRDTKLLITDYSSVAFDVSYQQKAVVAYQFDAEDFHYDYGITLEQIAEQATEYEQAKQLIINLIDSDFEISNTKKKSILDFFGINDNKNSERLYKYLSDKYLA